MCESVDFNGYVVWALVVEVADGYRLRLPLDDWERLGLHRGQRVTVRRRNNEEWLFLTEVVEQPPVVWVVMATRLRLAG